MGHGPELFNRPNNHGPESKVLIDFTRSGQAITPHVEELEAL